MTQEEFFKRYSYDVAEDRIGGGGFGTVYKAYDNTLHRDVAIKVAEVKTVNGKTFSLRDEIEALSGLPEHSNIANYEKDKLFTFKTPQGIFDYAVMQYYPDGNLTNAIKAGLTDGQKEDIATQLLEGIAFLHEHKVVHRDLKPGNILIVRHGGKVIPLITDFGLSKAADTGDGSVFSNSFGGGTQRYSSPEQLQGKLLRLNTDLWSYGAIVYELFTGEQLFSAGSGAANTAQADLEIYNKIVNGNVTNLGRMPEKWRKVAERCLVVDADKRAKDAGELLQFVQKPMVQSAVEITNPTMTSKPDTGLYMAGNEETQIDEHQTTQNPKSYTFKAQPIAEKTQTGSFVGKQDRGDLAWIIGATVLAVAIFFLSGTYTFYKILIWVSVIILMLIPLLKKRKNPQVKILLWQLIALGAMIVLVIVFKLSFGMDKAINPYRIDETLDPSCSILYSWWSWEIRCSYLVMLVPAIVMAVREMKKDKGMVWIGVAIPVIFTVFVFLFFHVFNLNEKVESFMSAGFDSMYCIYKVVTMPRVIIELLWVSAVLSYMLMIKKNEGEVDIRRKSFFLGLTIALIVCVLFLVVYLESTFSKSNIFFNEGFLHW